MANISSIKDMVTEFVSKAFLEVVAKDLSNEQARMHQRIDEIFDEAHKKAALTANKMALELIHKADLGVVSIEWKPK